MIITTEAQNIVLKHLFTGMSFLTINLMMYHGLVPETEIEEVVDEMMSEGLIEVKQAVVKTNGSYVIYKLKDTAEICINQKDDMK